MTSTWLKKDRKHVHVFPEDQEVGEVARTACAACAVVPRFRVADRVGTFLCQVYNEETDEWTKTCESCGFQVNFEKM